MARAGLMNHQMTLLMDAETKEKLSALTQNGRLSRGDVIRALIHFRYQMDVQRIPTCVTGTACHCPHTHLMAPMPQLPGALTPPV